jgi:hypothetical protein
MVQVRYRLTWQLALSIAIVVTVAIVPVIIYFLDYKEIFIYILSAVVGWTVLVLIAIMGAFLLGLAVGHRIASKSEFTPFEVEMIKMKEEVKHIKELVHKHNVHHGADKRKGGTERAGSERVKVERAEMEGGKRSPSRPETPSLVEEEPEMQRPTDPGPGMKPHGKVRCGKCKEVVPVYSKKRPLKVKCTNCGKEGVLR